MLQSNVKGGRKSLETGSSQQMNFFFYIYSLSSDGELPDLVHISCFPSYQANNVNPYPICSKRKGFWSFMRNMFRMA